MAQIRELTVRLTVEGPYDTDDTVAELGAALTNVIADAWGEVDPQFGHNAITNVMVFLPNGRLA